MPSLYSWAVHDIGIVTFLERLLQDRAEALGSQHRYNNYGIAMIIEILYAHRSEVHTLLTQINEETIASASNDWPLSEQAVVNILQNNLSVQELEPVLLEVN